MINNRNITLNKTKISSRRLIEASCILVTKNCREYFLYRNGDLTIYDMTGRGKGQVMLSKLELATIKELEQAKVQL